MPAESPILTYSPIIMIRWFRGQNHVLLESLIRVMHNHNLTIHVICDLVIHKYSNLQDALLG